MSQKDDPISRQAAIDAIDSIESELANGLGFQYEKWRKHFVDLPPTESEIIACGDCKHWICHDRRCGYWNHGVKPLDWCSHAESIDTDKEAADADRD